MGGAWRHGRGTRCCADAQDAAVHQHELVSQEPAEEEEQGHVLHICAAIVDFEAQVSSRSRPTAQMCRRAREAAPAASFAQPFFANGKWKNPMSTRRRCIPLS